MGHPDICIAGAGIIGLSLALELHHRGADVVVIERNTALSHASIAAAGMLAAHDPENPPLLRPLSELSVALYPEFLARIEALSGLHVPFQTSRTFQAHPDVAPNDTTRLPGLIPGQRGFRILEEHSVDPRQLASALLAAIRRTSIRIVEQTQLQRLTETYSGIHLQTSTGTFDTARLVRAMGAWSFAPIVPRKGQMLTVLLPSSPPLQDVIRTPEIYIVPRTQGPAAGRVLIGATVEDVGYDTTTHPADLDHLRAAAAALLPALADTELCPAVDQWAGLRPATPDGLPILGHCTGSERQFVATGHYRNGILLAPATARVLAQLIEGIPTSVDLAAFTASRFPAEGNIAQLC